MTEEIQRATAPPARRLSPRTTFSYGFGAVAYGIKDSGFGTFLPHLHAKIASVRSDGCMLLVYIRLPP